MAVEAEARMPSMKREAIGMMTNCRLPSPLSTVCAAKRMATKRMMLPDANAAHPPNEYALLPAFCLRHLPSGRRLRRPRESTGGWRMQQRRRRAVQGLAGACYAGPSSATQPVHGMRLASAHQRGGCRWPRGTCQVDGSPVESMMECATLTLAWPNTISTLPSMCSTAPRLPSPTRLEATMAVAARAPPARGRQWQRRWAAAVGGGGMEGGGAAGPCCLPSRDAAINAWAGAGASRRRRTCRPADALRLCS